MESSDIFGLIGLAAALYAVIQLQKYAEKKKQIAIDNPPRPQDPFRGVTDPHATVEAGTISPAIKQYYWLYPASGVPDILKPKPPVAFNPVDPVWGCPAGYAAINTGRAPGQGPISYCQQINVRTKITDFPVAFGYD